LRLLIIDIDTLRADHLHCAGYPRATTPNIDELARTGVRFANVFASDVPCLPSRTAFSTGRFGIANGVVSHGGLAADLRPTGAERDFIDQAAARAFASVFFWAGWRTVSLSSFPFRHSAPWWTNGFQEYSNPMRNIGRELATEVEPHALDWLERNGRGDRWLLHVHLWDPHTPYRTPASFGNPFADEPAPGWITDEVLDDHRRRPGPHSALDAAGWAVDQYDAWPRQPRQITSLDDVKALFDGYDTGVRYADDTVGRLLTKLDDLGVRDETAVYVTADHGEQLGELGAYADHMAADDATAHIPSVLAWPGLPAGVDDGLHYHLDITATIAELAGLRVPLTWHGSSFAEAMRAGRATGRPELVLSQGAWTCQRAVRTDQHLYVRTWHDGYHDWPEEMLFDMIADPYEQHDLAEALRDIGKALADRLASWTSDQLDATGQPDPMVTVLDEGGPWHCRGQLAGHLDRLVETGRGDRVAALLDRHGAEVSPADRQRHAGLAGS
jgi:choline-sulfatase